MKFKEIEYIVRLTFQYFRSFMHKEESLRWIDTIKFTIVHKNIFSLH